MVSLVPSATLWARYMEIKVPSLKVLAGRVAQYEPHNLPNTHMEIYFGEMWDEEHDQEDIEK